jgi:hypothetical protein
MEQNNLDIQQFSSHLFWDVKRELLHTEDSRGYIIKRVLEYGLLEDWQLIRNYYGLEQIKDTVIEFRELEPKALNMVALLSNTPKEKFRCYNTTRLTNKHWNF